MSTAGAMSEGNTSPATTHHDNDENVQNSTGIYYPTAPVCLKFKILTYCTCMIIDKSRDQKASN